MHFIYLFVFSLRTLSRSFMTSRFIFFGWIRTLTTLSKWPACKTLWLLMIFPWSFSCLDKYNSKRKIVTQLYYPFLTI